MSYGIKEHEKYGYKHLDPIPSLEEISSFYEDTFAEMVEKGKTGPGMKRLLEGGEEAEWEREWRRSTWYTDVVHFIRSINPDSTSLLDVGCGVGEFLLFAEDAGFDTIGVEPSSALGEKARDKDLDVYIDRIEEFSEYCSRKFDVIVLIQVLHHVRNPIEVIGRVRRLLSEDGIIVVKVPNDFSKLQKSVVSKSDAKKWWVNPPMVINYFDHKSLKNTLEKEGLNVKTKYADFPMEIFPLMGDNYISGPISGRECHKKRVLLEKSITDEVRREIYLNIAKIGIGRNITCFGVKK